MRGSHARFGDRPLHAFPLLPPPISASIYREICMRSSTALRAGCMAFGLTGLSLWLGASTAFAVDRGFPDDGTFLLEAKPMKGSKRIPVLQIESASTAAVNLWCNTVPAQFVVADNTITVILGSPTQQQCPPDRMQADQDLMDALQQVTTWRRQDDLLVLQGDRSLRFRLSSN
jgi:heat shock protein HslJ